MGNWTYDEAKYPGGLFRLTIRKRTRGGTTADVTSVRGAPTQLTNYGSADPFGDASALFSFPRITAFDDLKASDLTRWLGYYSDVDLWWVPTIERTADYPPAFNAVIDPFTQRPDLIAPSYFWKDGVQTTKLSQIKVWEGFIADMNFGEERGELQIQCQGAVFQVDRYLQKPFFPARPWPLESLIGLAFSHAERPHLRTQSLRTVFPTGWTKKVPRYVGGSANVYSPVARPGTKWTGLTSRTTGAWERSLTGFVQNQLTSMITDGQSGVRAGNQWTIQQARANQTAANAVGRQPVLTVRDRNRAPDFSVQHGAPGVKLRVAGDSTQSENVVYGDGTDLNGQVWRNAIVSNDGSRTDYLPLAAAREVYPPNKNSLAEGGFVTEAYTKFGTGFSQEDGADIAKQQLARDIEPGWSGTLDLTVDPSPLLPRWLIRAGMTVLVKNFLGTGEQGVPFHVSAVTANPMDQSVTLTIDTRYRDLLTVAEAQQRARDPLTPVRMLQVNRTSVMIEDVQAPWDYSAGSGFIPKASKELYKNKPRGESFPQVDWVRKHPPLHYPGYYVRVKANAKRPNQRWSGRVPILTAERGTINRIEIFCVDSYGRPLKIPFHISFYYTPVNVDNMPRRGGQSSPYFDGAFESVNPGTGQSWPAGNFLAPDTNFIIGWGNKAAGKFQRAGFSPGSERAGGRPTGLLTDDATWTFDNTNNPDFDKLAKPGQRQRSSAITIYAMIYAEAPRTAWFGGRLYRQNPGQG